MSAPPKLSCLALAVALAAATSITGVVAADVNTSRVVTRTYAPQRVPLALRTLSRRSASVMASTPCWEGCTTACGSGFQACLRTGPLEACLAGNNGCELACLKHCRLMGGPLLDITDY